MAGKKLHCGKEKTMKERVDQKKTENLQAVLDAVNGILCHITRLDRAKNAGEFDEILQGLLEAIGNCTDSDRAYVFELLNKKDAFRMTHEWCAKGVSQTFASMQYVRAQAIPNWMSRFQKGESIISEDWEADKSLFPEEFQEFDGQEVYTLIVIPIFSNNKLKGYIGLDNPEQSVSELTIQLLSSVAGHLGSIKENFYIVSELEEKQRQLTQSLYDLEYERQLLDALCIDYTSAYYCDLLADTIIPVKQGKYTNANLTEKKLVENELHEKKQCYSFRIRYYFEHFVIKESAPDFVEKLNAGHVMQFLENNERMLYRFSAKPNALGQKEFEVQFVRLKDRDGFKVVMGYRYVDDLIAEQDRQREVMENALADANLNNEIISSISKIYWLIYRMDLETDTYEEISAGREMHRLTGNRGKITKEFKNVRECVVSPEYQEKMREFLDIFTLPERLKDTETIATEYHAANGSWHLGRFIVKKRDERGKVTHVLYLAREINTEKQQEMEYEKRLAMIAAEAQRANMAKTDFLRRMSHDIRTPINGIRGILSIANHYPDDLQKQQECRDKAMEASSFLLSLVNNVLDMNKLESGRIVLEHKPFDLFELFQESNIIMEMQSQMKDISFTVDNYGISHRHLLGSPLHLKQILQNIVGNAMKYNRPGGGVTVTCTEISYENGKATYQFGCMDTGYGMSEEFQKHAFEPFAQETSDARTKYMGTGLGLSIVKQLIDLMGGSIFLESKQDVGTKFTFFLTFDIDLEHESREQTKADTADICLFGVKILLVEDNELNMEIAKFLLEQAGLIVETAWNGQEAVDIFLRSEEYEFDLILMDIMMPVMDGLEAARIIRRSERKDAVIPIFAMTANAFLEDIQQSKEAGMNEHFSKPLQEKEMLGAIMRYVQRFPK